VATVTGVVEEYLALAEEADADLLAMQVGDFYEFFANGARTVADELDLKVSEKSSHGSAYPMAGVPVDDLTPYLVQLVERGYRVAVADQRGSDDTTREITRVVTPGTLLETADAAAQYLAVATQVGDEYGLALVDVTTGRFRVTAVADADAALDELRRFDPVEVVPGPDLREGAFATGVEDAVDATVTDHDAEAFAPGRAAHAVREQFGDSAAESVGLDPDGAAVVAAGAALAYVAETGAGVLGSLSRIQPYRVDDQVALDATTRRNLELVETMEGERAGSLLATVDHTTTAAGRRLLREWLQRPRQSRAELDRRADAVEALAGAVLGHEAVRDALDDAADLARLASRATSGSADARDLLRVRDTLDCLPALRDAVATTPGLAESPLGDVLDRADPERAAALRDRIAEALVEDPPATTTEGGLFRRGYDDELDELAARQDELETWLDEFESGERERLGITHLQVDRNRTDGYYVQVGNSETDAVPEEYREVKSLKNSTRYTTDALDERERELLRVEEQRAERETDLFERLRAAVADEAALLQDAGRALAEVDVFASLATHAAENGWTRPALVDGDGFEVEGGRHPVVEQTTEFVPNDAALGRGSGADRRFLLVTGPNMSGKSTYMRQVALTTLLAQVGSFVPADRAEIGLVDGIYTRVGALDELAEGRSTFMVEMQELSNILHSATERSLVVLDEVGRGTATYDGISIAWAATEYLHNRVDALTLFATHYHELTALADHLDRVANVHVAAREDDGDVTFLRTVREGATDRSYGIHVADLAGVPSPVVDRSREVLDRLREEKAVEARGAGDGGDGSDTRQVVFDLEAGRLRSGDGDAGVADGGDALDEETAAVLDEIRETDVAETRPVDLLGRVEEWQRRLGE
jgi:DNA mismatch repair protein MutS